MKVKETVFGKFAVNGRIFPALLFTERNEVAVADEIEGEGGRRVGWFDAQYIWRRGLASAYSRVTFE